ncbi:MAG: hypothetical protein J2O48_00110 [Solirubrobacterales bacterium]|nr:hypothetical protein [Solirubrobacterales bacterium]
MSDTAQRLLDAQVRFFLTQLEPEQFNALLEPELDHALELAGELQLEQVVTREQIKATARKWAVQVRVPGSIPELASEIANRLYNHPAQAENRLDQVVAAQHVEAFTAKFLELPLVQERLLESPLMVEIASEWLYRLASDAISQNRNLAGRVPGLNTLLGTGEQLLGAVAPDASAEFDVRLRELAEPMARVLLSRSKHALAGNTHEPWARETVVEAWREQSSRPVSSLRSYVTQDDLEDLLVLVYEFWLSLRETEYVHVLIADGVDFFFDKYGTARLLELLGEFGVTRADMLEEARRFGPPVLALLRENGMLEQLIRRRLEPFFESPAAREIIGD